MHILLAPANTGKEREQLSRWWSTEVAAAAGQISVWFFPGPKTSPASAMRQAQRTRYGREGAFADAFLMGYAPAAWSHPHAHHGLWHVCQMRMCMSRAGVCVCVHLKAGVLQQACRVERSLIYLPVCEVWDFICCCPFGGDSVQLSL